MSQFDVLPEERTVAATVAALESHGFTVEVVDDLAAARKAVLARIPHGARRGFLGTIVGRQLREIAGIEAGDDGRHGVVAALAFGEGLELSHQVFLVHASQLGIGGLGAVAVHPVAGRADRPGDLPGIGMVIIDGLVRCGRSRNTPPADRMPIVVPR